MGDMEKVVAECRAKRGVQEISDACARVIASLYHDGQWSLAYSFASTGAITDHPEQVWREMFGALYSGASRDEKLVMDMMGTYLTRAGRRGPVRGWSGLWL
ncbi:hypothetical protein ACQPZP_40785 [Spirillospora sp. CA-142024]|uniref:hypothetical protein n=1 Tax=Spirillospora sp. CA-142024 TaxID=3240036 RepID=UPI003D8B5E8D